MKIEKGESYLSNSLKVENMTVGLIERSLVAVGNNVRNINF